MIQGPRFSSRIADDNHNYILATPGIGTPLGEKLSIAHTGTPTDLIGIRHRLYHTPTVAWKQIGVMIADMPLAFVGQFDVSAGKDMAGRPSLVSPRLKSVTCRFPLSNQ